MPTRKVLQFVVNRKCLDLERTVANTSVSSNCYCKPLTSPWDESPIYAAPGSGTETYPTQDYPVSRSERHSFSDRFGISMVLKSPPYL